MMFKLLLSLLLCTHASSQTLRIKGSRPSGGKTLADSVVLSQSTDYGCETNPDDLRLDERVSETCYGKVSMESNSTYSESIAMTVAEKVHDFVQENMVPRVKHFMPDPARMTELSATLQSKGKVKETMKGKANMEWTCEITIEHKEHQDFESTKCGFKIHIIEDFAP